MWLAIPVSLVIRILNADEIHSTLYIAKLVAINAPYRTINAIRCVCLFSLSLLDSFSIDEDKELLAAEQCLPKLLVFIHIGVYYSTEQTRTNR